MKVAGGFNLRTEKVGCHVAQRRVIENQRQGIDYDERYIWG